MLFAQTPLQSEKGKKNKQFQWQQVQKHSNYKIYDAA